MDVMKVSGMDVMIVMIVREGYKSWEKARVIINHKSGRWSDGPGRWTV